MSAKPQLAPQPIQEVQNTATEPPPTLGQETSEPTRQTEIAQLAYVLWQQRGCPVGSAEIDWQETEQQLSR